MGRRATRPLMPALRQRAGMAMLAVAVAAAHLLLLSAPAPGSGARSTGAPGARAATAPLRLRALGPSTAAEQGTPPAEPPPRAAAPRRSATESDTHRAAGGAMAASARAPSEPAPSAAPAPATAGAAGPLPDAPAAAALPGPLSLRFQLAGRSRGRDVRGESVLSFQHDGQRYEIRHEIRADPPGVRLQTSVGLLGPLGLAPRRFGEHRRTEEAVHFDAQQGRIVFSAAVPAAPLWPGAQDRLSMLLQLGALIAAQPAAFGPGRTIALQVAGAREAAVWPLTVIGEEDLDLPSGRLRTLHLVRPPQREWEPRLDLWLAPGRAYVPARLRLTGPDGDWLEYLGLPTDRA